MPFSLSPPGLCRGCWLGDRWLVSRGRNLFPGAVLSQQVAGENPLPYTHLQPVELHIVLGSCPTDTSQKEARAVVLRCDVALGNDNHIVWPPVQSQLDKPFSSSGFLVTECLHGVFLCKVLPGPSLLNGAPCHIRAI